MPLAGKVLEVNPALEADPSLRETNLTEPVR